MIVPNPIAALAVEYWKLIKSFERAAELAPEGARSRLLAQARYSNTKLESILESLGMRVITFDGLPFEVQMPAVAINVDQFSGGKRGRVERTLEPAIMSDMTVIATGKVFLTVSEENSAEQ